MTHIQQARGLTSEAQRIRHEAGELAQGKTGNVVSGLAAIVEELASLLTRHMETDVGSIEGHAIPIRD